MALTRPLKEGSVTTYQQKVALGFPDILASEVDADLDTIYGAWNGTLGGDLTGTLPNPTVAAAAKSKWTVSGATLTPTDATKRVTVPGPTAAGADQSAIGLGTRTGKLRLHALPTSDFAAITLNNWYDGSAWNRDDGTKAGWQIAVRNDTDNFAIGRQPAAGGATASLLAVDNAGNLSVGGTTLNLATGVNQHGALLAWNSGGSPTVDLSANPSQFLTTRPVWLLRLASDTSDQASFQRQTPSGGGWLLTLVSGAAGDLIIAGAIAQKASGTTWANPSDPRLKDDVASYAAGLAEICALDPITYHLKASPDGPLCYGFDASAVRDVMPECVSTTRMKLDPRDEEETEDVLLFDLHPVLVALVNAVKELAARLEAVEARA